MSKGTKKGRNPGAVDNWLETLGLYRKNVAYDETCLFRAVSEQVYDCQIHHERVRKECISYARQNYKEFADLVQCEEDWLEHLYELENHMVVCGSIEINIVSLKYERDVVIFDAARFHVFNATKKTFPNTFLLCLMDKDHYDVVYEKDHIAVAGFCQSIIYKILYEEVFGISGVDEIVNSMLYDRNILTEAEILMEKRKMLAEANNNDPELLTLEERLEEKPSSSNVAPFPFKVAKALDPTIYRNIEYDSWGEVRRELRLGDWYYGDDKLILGTRCIFNDVQANEKYDCYIQEIKDDNNCVVYLTKLAEKRTVSYSDLSPEDDAKPWPLPYRFSKNLSLYVPNQSSPFEAGAQKSRKRFNKDKKRTKSESSVSSNITAAVTSDTVENVNAYVGAPLQMQTHSVYQQSEVVQTPDQRSTISEEESHSTSYQWDHSQWGSYLTPTPDPFIWPQAPGTSQNVFNFNLKPMVASAPVTPNVVPYHDTNYPYYYNHPIDLYQTYPQWNSPAIELLPPPTKVNYEKQQAQLEASNQSQATQVDTVPFQNGTNEIGQETTRVSVPEGVTLCTALTSQSPSLDVYSPMIPLPPGTPVLYTTVPQDMNELVMHSPSVLYPTPMEMQYMPPAPYVYPPTPPATWYPAGVTPQGFIFPSRPN